MEMPSQEEQIIAEQYVLRRKITRPDTDVRKVTKYISAYLIMSFLIASVSFYLFDWLGIFLAFPDNLLKTYGEHPVLFVFIYFICVYFIIGLFCLKSALIGAIRLYQHYAPEDVRRRCLFKPTCSEYAILAIKKYGVIIGLFKSYIRLFKKCRGNIYRIDYP